jgi:transcriptional/translational regulatory protein YebC/TACO1
VVYAPFESFGQLQKYFEENNIEIISSGFDRIPTMTKKLTEEEKAEVEILLDKIEEDEDVQNVFTTMV